MHVDYNNDITQTYYARVLLSACDVYWIYCRLSRVVLQK